MDDTYKPDEIEYPPVPSHDTYIDASGVEWCAACEAAIGCVNDFGDRPIDFVKHTCNPADVYRTCMSYRDMLKRLQQEAIDDKGVRLDVALERVGWEKV